MKAFLQLKLLFLYSSFVKSFESACTGGQVKDLDGTCVDKVPFPPRVARKSCPEPVIEHGNLFLRMGGRIADFYCDTEYIRVPDTEASICQVTGFWSKEIPTCLKPGCKIPGAPENGDVILDFETARAVFSCNHGYIIQGPVYLGCVDGTSWNDTAPACHQITTTTTTTTTTTLKPKIISVKSSAPTERFSSILVIALVAISVAKF